MRNILGERVLGLPKEPGQLPRAAVERGAALRLTSGATRRVCSIRPWIDASSSSCSNAGATPDEIAPGRAEGWLTLLAIDRSLFRDRPQSPRGRGRRRSPASIPRCRVRALARARLPRRPGGRAGVHRRVGRRSCARCSERVEAWFDAPRRAGRGPSRPSCSRCARSSGGFARVAEVLSDHVVDSVEAAPRAPGSTTRRSRWSTSRTSTGRSLARLFDYVLRAAGARRGAGASSRTDEPRPRRARARGRVPRPRRVHRAEPGARGRRARRARHPVRGADPRHGRASSAGGS